MPITQVFRHGSGHAVRIPKAFRFDAKEVRISRDGPRIILEPIPRDWAWLDDLSGPLDADFIAAAEASPDDHQ